MGIGMVCIMMTWWARWDTFSWCQLRRSERFHSRAVRRWWCHGRWIWKHYKALGPWFRVCMMWRLQWWAESTRSSGSSLHSVSVCMSVGCIPQHLCKLHVFTSHCSSTQNSTQMGHLKYPYECTAINMRRAAVSMSKYTPVYDVYKVHPDSDCNVSHPFWDRQWFPH